MSYKFEIHRCTDCGAVWFDPQWPPSEWRRCGLVYTFDAPSGRALTATCPGTVRAFAGVDSDSFMYMVTDWSKRA